MAGLSRGEDMLGGRNSACTGKRELLVFALPRGTWLAVSWKEKGARV